MDVDMDNLDVIIDDEPLTMEREDRPRSRTWPILPPPIETIHEHERDAEIAEPPPIIEEVELEEDSNESQKTSETNPRKNSRKNAWGNLSYADLITQAIQTAPEQRLTLSQIYEWMVRNIAYFKDKGDSTSSAGWKNSIRHNLSLHNRFMRVQNDSNGKSSYWVINADAKPGKSSRRRSGSVDGQPKGEKKRIKNKKLHQSTDDISALSPNSIKYKQNRSYDNLLNATSPCSSTDSLANLDEFHNELNTPYAGDSFNRPRSTSNVSTQSSVNGRMTPIHGDVDGDLLRLEDNQIRVNGGADEAMNMVEQMRIDNHYATNINNNITINLNDSLKLVKTDQQKYINCNDPMMPPRRAHSDSFGSGDSGYDSPAAYFPPQVNSSQTINVSNRVQINKSLNAPNGIPPNAIPNKPPPPYNGGFPPLRQQQQQQGMFPGDGGMPQNNFYGMAPHPVRSTMNNMPSSAPRLKHLPITSPATAYSAVQSQTSTQQYNQHMNRTFSMQVQNNASVFATNNPYHNHDPVAAQQAVDMKIKQEFENTKQQQQQQQQQQNFNTNNVNVGGGWDHMEIPSDLSQVKLFDFQDQQQLQSDLDAIIKNDLNVSATSLQSICEPYGAPNIKSFNNDLNNNKVNINHHPNYVPSFPAGQDWVR